MADLRIRQNARNVNVLKDVLRTLNNTHFWKKLVGLSPARTFVVPAPDAGIFF
jgi:hypothetical protein